MLNGDKNKLVYPKIYYKNNKKREVPDKLLFLEL